MNRGISHPAKRRSRGCGSFITPLAIQLFLQGNILQDSETRDMVQHRHGAMMQTKEWTKIWHNSQLDLEFLHAYYVQHAYPRHSHDYYVLTLIERGRQSFTHKGAKYLTPPGGVILINPDATHTGEAADQYGFEMRALYPTTALMEMVAFELTGRHQALPFFKEVRVDDRWAANSILSLHKAISQETSTLESESRILWSLAQFIKQYADTGLIEQPLGQERKAIQRARQYIEDCFAEGMTLNKLAQEVALSPYYLLRVFHAEVGMPPYAYLESVRIRHAQQLIKAGRALAEVAIQAGFSSQSHMTRHFKKIIGVTPGQYARQVRL
ncbi:MAG TPA: AraC family transcriptional regulator [Anaerolineales bacterium]|nr:AraC family transcriptional regulator [Anaerolineales bacterium]